MQRIIQAQLKRWQTQAPRKPLLLRGARQVGKTYALKNFGASAFPRYHYLNFEEMPQLAKFFQTDLQPKRILNELGLFLERPIDVTHDLLIFDEIQACPLALNSLKYFAEQMSDLAICAAGSLLGVQLSDTPFPVGKVEFLDMYPLSFLEFLHASEESTLYDFLQQLTSRDVIADPIHERLWRLYTIYLVTGGLPEAVQAYVDHRDDLFTALSEVRKRQKSLLSGYHADMAKHAGKQNALHLERLWDNIPKQLARTHDGTAPKFRFGGVLPNIKGYARLAGALDWLIAAGLVIPSGIVHKAALPLTAYTKENAMKLFVFDVGILGALSDLPPQTMLDSTYGSYKGYVAENAVAQAFRGAGVERLYAWSERTAEVEFLRVIDGDIIPIEVKSGWVTQAKSLRVYSEKYHPPYRVIMSAHNLRIDRHHGVHHYPLYLAGQFPLR